MANDSLFEALTPAFMFYYTLFWEMLPPWVKGLLWWMGDQTVIVGFARQNAEAAFAVNLFMFVGWVLILPAIVTFLTTFVTAVSTYAAIGAMWTARLICLTPLAAVKLLSTVSLSALTMPFRFVVRTLRSFASFPSMIGRWALYLLWLLWILPVLPHKLFLELCWLVYELPALVRVLYGLLFFGPSTKPLRVEQGAGAIPSGQDIPGGDRLSRAEGLAHVSASGALSSVPRLRARGCATNALQSLLSGPVGSAGAFLRGRWTPDLPSSDRSPILNALLATSSQEMKLLGVGAIRTNARPGPQRVVYVVVETAQGRELVFPALLGRLQQYSLLRERTPELLRGLKARAIEWMKEQEVPAWVSPLAVPGAVARACLETTTEIGAKSQLEAAGLGGLLDGA